VNRTHKRWLAISAAGLAGLLVLCVLGNAFNREDRDPNRFVRDTYERAASLDEPDGGAAYTSPRSRTSVVSELRRNTREHDHRSTDGIDFLQYDRHLVAVHDHGRGSKIYVDDYRDGYQRYSTSYAFFPLFGWSSAPPAAGGFRGGSGGFGK
jgi:hypothetical protein